MTNYLTQRTEQLHRSNHLQNPDQSGDYRHCHGARLWRGLVGDLDVVSPLSIGEIIRRHGLAAGDDSAAPGAFGAIDWQRGGE